MEIGLGLALGCLVALILSLILRFVTGPIVEFLQEFFEAKRDPTTLPAEPVGKLAVVVSDLHMDTWKDAPENVVCFAAFVDSVIKDPRVTSLYFGGDLLDIPLHPNFHRQTALLQIGSEVDVQDDLFVGQEPLIQILVKLFLTKKRIVGITGNHDQGIGGLRFIRNAEGYPHALWNPALRVSGHPQKEFVDRSIYLEHGHRFDPLNWLYLRYSILDLNRKGSDRASAVSPLSERGLRNIVEKPKREAGVPIAPKKDSAMTWLVRMRYRRGARIALGELRARGVDSDGKPIRAFLCGHTHLPDRFEFPTATYLNLGDWSASSGHRTFVLIDENGDVFGPYDWNYKESGLDRFTSCVPFPL